MSTLNQPASLRATFVGGVRWKVVGQTTVQASRIIVTIVLARLLLPRDFGLAGMVLVFAGLIQLFADFGFSASIIQHKVITDADRSTAFWVNVSVGVALTGVGIIAAPFVAHFYGQPSLDPLLIALSLTFLIGALGSTQASLLMREMRFRELELTTAAASLTGALVAVFAALAGAGVWALILQTVTMSAVTTTLLWLWLGWKPRLIVSRTSLRKLWGFGAGVFGSRIFSYLGRDSDNLLVGRFLGAHALGLYSMAYAVIALPFDRVQAPLQSLLSPMFARLQDDLERSRDVWLQGLRMCTALIAPLTVGAMILAPEFVRVVLGERWLPCVRVVQVLAYVACIQSATFLAPVIFASRYRTGLLFRVSMTCYAAHLCAFVVGLHWGVLGVAIGYAFSNTLVAVPLTVTMTARVLRASARAVLDSVVGVVTATAGMALLTALGALAVGALSGGAGPRLVAGLVIGTASYVPLVIWREPRLRVELPVPSRLCSVLRRRAAALPSLPSDSFGS